MYVCLERTNDGAEQLGNGVLHLLLQPRQRPFRSMQKATSCLGIHRARLISN